MFLLSDIIKLLTITIRYIECTLLELIVYEYNIVCTYSHTSVACYDAIQKDVARSRSNN